MKLCGTELSERERVTKTLQLMLTVVLNHTSSLYVIINRTITVVFTAVFIRLLYDTQVTI